jgi:hypothetical protein
MGELLAVRGESKPCASSLGLRGQLGVPGDVAALRAVQIPGRSEEGPAVRAQESVLAEPGHLPPLGIQQVEGAQHLQERLGMPAVHAEHSAGCGGVEAGCGSESSEAAELALALLAVGKLGQVAVAHGECRLDLALAFVGLQARKPSEPGAILHPPQNAGGRLGWGCRRTGECASGDVEGHRVIAKALRQGQHGHVVEAVDVAQHRQGVGLLHAAELEASPCRQVPQAGGDHDVGADWKQIQQRPERCRRPGVVDHEEQATPAGKPAADHARIREDSTDVGRVDSQGGTGDGPAGGPCVGLGPYRVAQLHPYDPTGVVPPVLGSPERGQRGLAGAGASVQP